MEGRRMASSGIVREVLTRYNYEEWKTLMKSYLRGKNLWDVVVGSGSTSKPIDAQRDAKALHIIQLSCGSEIFDQIKHFETANIAWNHLARVYGSEFQAQPHIRPGVISDNVSEHKDLYEFVKKGDWEGASSYLREKPDAIFWAPASGRTVLHVATMEGHYKIVKMLVELGKEKLVEMQDEDGYTALALAAGYSGRVSIVLCILVGVGNERRVLALPNKKDETPILLAADSGNKEMTRYLYLFTPPDVLQQQSPRYRDLLLERCIQAHIFDVVLWMLKTDPVLVIGPLHETFKKLDTLLGLHTEPLPYGVGGLDQLARLPPGLLDAPNSLALQTILDDMTYGTGLGLALNLGLMALRPVGAIILRWALRFMGIKPNLQDRETVLRILMYYKDRVTKLNSSELREASVYDAMLDAAKHGNVDFINAMWEANHDLLWAMDNHGRDIFSYAVLHRKENVFRLMHTLCLNKDIINFRTDMFGNNLLHLAARLGPFSDLNLRPGAALQMRREIQWFKAVDEIMHLKCREARNDEGKTPVEIFRETHQELMKDGEKWAKQTAETFAIVGVLVITVMFAAVFTVPGGYHAETGVPIFINEKKFTVFIVADVISLFASIFAVLIYIDIQTSRYTETDFLSILPSKIMAGLGLLSMSLVSMMFAFGAALAIVLQESREYKKLFVAVVVLTSFPFGFLLPSQLRLLRENLQFITSNPIRVSKLPAVKLRRDIFSDVPKELVDRTKSLLLSI